MQAMPILRPTDGRATLVRLAEYVSFALAYVTVILGIALIVALIGCVLLQIVYRYGLNSPLAWTDESALLLFVWCTLLFASLCVRDRAHVRLTALVNAFPAVLKPVLDRLTMILIVLFGSILVYQSSELIDLVWGDRSPAVHYPLQLLYGVIPVHGILIVIHAATNVFLDPVPGPGVVE